MKYWQVLWNRPGTLPEMEPLTFETFDEAKRHLISELKREEDFCTENEAEEYCHMAELVNLESSNVPFVTPPLPNGYLYSVTEYIDTEY